MMTACAAHGSRRRDLAGIVEEHLPLVDHVVYKVAVHFPRHVDREELARAGAVGLIEAAQRYDATRGVPFESFATQRIRGAILDAVRSADWAPRSLRRAARTLDLARQNLAVALGRPPTVVEIADELHMSVDKVQDLQGRVHRSVVLALDENMIIEDDEELALAEVVADRTESEPSDELERRELHAYLRDAVRLLPDRHRTVIVGYFFEGWTSQQLADVLQVTESRISQLRSEAFAMMRDGLEAQYPLDEASEEQEPKGRSARRKAAYADALAAHSDFGDRLNPVKLVEPIGDLTLQVA
jgi:RNA polymerase sigma factor for flagellar operon FliA